MTTTDRLLHDASASLRRISLAKTSAAVEENRRQLEHYLLPAIAGEYRPGVAKALHLALEDLLEKRDRS